MFSLLVIFKKAFHAPEPNGTLWVGIKGLDHPGGEGLERLMDPFFLIPVEVDVPDVEFVILLEVGYDPNLSVGSFSDPVDVMGFLGECFPESRERFKGLCFGVELIEAFGGPENAKLPDVLDEYRAFYAPVCGIEMSDVHFPGPPPLKRLVGKRMDPAVQGSHPDPVPFFALFDIEYGVIDPFELPLVLPLIGGSPVQGGHPVVEANVNPVFVLWRGKNDPRIGILEMPDLKGRRVFYAVSGSVKGINPVVRGYQ